MKISTSSVLVIGALSIIGYVYAEQPKPAIHIKHKLDNVHVRNMLKISWDICANEKKMYQDAKKSGHLTWPIMEEELKENRPDYDVDAALDTPTDWKRFANETEQEYFFNDKYASYKQSSKYTISKDGRCSVLVEPKHSATLDNGQFRYLVNVSNGTAVKYKSGVVSIRENDKLLRSQENEAALVAAANKLGMPANKSVITVGSERILGNHTCDYKVIKEGQRSKICYWTKMNHYPSVLERPIILKSIIYVGNDKNVKQAEIFKVTSKIDDSIFVPKSDFKIKDRTKY